MGRRFVFNIGEAAPHTAEGCAGGGGGAGAGEGRPLLQWGFGSITPENFGNFIRYAKRYILGDFCAIIGPQNGSILLVEY